MNRLTPTVALCRAIGISLLGVPLFLAAGHGRAADAAYPARAVRIIVPFAPGGTADITGRVIAAALAEQTGKPFVAENHTGAGGIVGHSITTKAAPDGHTLSIADPSFLILPSITRNMPFDVIRDFTPISQIIGVPLGLVVPQTLKVGSLEQFIDLARRNGGQFNYGSAGVGTLTMLVAELFKRSARVDIAHVPYKGSGDVMAALLTGSIQMTITTVPTVMPYVSGGKLLVLAVTTDGKRAQTLPNVPTMGEAGVGGMAVSGWFGLVGPPNIPRPLLAAISAQVVKAATSPAVRSQFAAQGGEVVASKPEEYAALFNAELKRWTEVTKAAGIAPE